MLYEYITWWSQQAICNIVDSPSLDINIEKIYTFLLDIDKTITYQNINRTKTNFSSVKKINITNFLNLLVE